MESKRLRELLIDVAEGRATPDEAAEKLKTLPFDDIGFAKLDTHRELRTGRGEVIFGIGKTPEQVAVIMKRLSAEAPLVIATKVGPEYYAATRETVREGLVYFEQAKLLVYRAAGEIAGAGMAEAAGAVEVCTADEGTGAPDAGRVAVVCAGTADIPIAEEAAITSELYGAAVDRYYDVGVAGIHRLLDKAAEIRKAKAVVVVAGMEGALASVVGGLVDAPVVAVPTSIGYGASMGGLAALLTMLNSCSLGVSVVNIDNGFGAGYTASLIVSHRRCQSQK
jgi:NCAIR mutase (PurE)-related protein